MAKQRGLFRRGGIWWIRFTSINGNQIRESSHSTKKEDAELLFAKRMQAVLQGQDPEIQRIPNISFRELSEKYLAWVKGRQASYEVKTYIIKQLVSVFGDLPLKRFTTSIVDQLQSDLISKGYKPSSNNKITNVLKHMFGKAVEWDLTSEDVLKRIRKVKPLRDEGKRLRYLSKEEIQILLSACDANIKPIVITALNTGMRKGEILNLRWDTHIDLKHNRILLDKTKNGERREIPINNTLRATLKGLTRRLDIGYIFFNHQTGLPYHKDLKRRFNTALKKAGIRDFHFHDLRHTFASHLVMAGVDIVTVSKLLGHKSLKMTLRYSHLSPGHLDNAVRVLDVLTGSTISTMDKKLAQF